MALFYSLKQFRMVGVLLWQRRQGLRKLEEILQTIGCAQCEKVLFNLREPSRQGRGSRAHRVVLWVVDIVARPGAIDTRPPECRCVGHMELVGVLVCAGCWCWRVRVERVLATDTSSGRVRL